MKKFILTLLPILFLVGCNTGQIENSYQEGYNSGKDTGYNSGVVDGKAVGIEEGKNIGKEEGLKEGYTNGQKDCPKFDIITECYDVAQKRYFEGVEVGKEL